MPTPAIQTLVTDAQQVLNLSSISAVRATVAVALANANTGTPLNPNLTTQQLWDQFYQVVTQPKSDIESIIANQLMKFLYAPPAPGGVGADKQVIFNDGGTLAGDADFIWNKTTNLLTVTGSATITGDLTVDTSTLKVDSTNNRVGIGTASPTVPLYVQGNNATATAIIQDETNGAKLRMLANSINFDITNGGGGGEIAVSGANPITFRTNSSERARIDGSGNLGLGVTPSAGGSQFYKTFELGKAGCGLFAATAVLTGSELTYLSGNGVLKYNAGPEWSYGNAGSAAIYGIEDGVHKWFNAGSGSAGGVFVPTQAMTLDASGNLLVGTASSPAYGSKLRVQGGIETFSSQFNAAPSTAVSFEFVNRAAAGFDFYVNSGTQLAAKIKVGGQIRFQPLAADPAGAEAGDVYYNSVSNKLKCYNGTSWNDLF